MGVSELLARAASGQAHALVVEVPGWWRVRADVERAVFARGWSLAFAPADADVLVVCGEPGPRLAEAVELVWHQLPGPRVRVDVRDYDDAARRLDDAHAALLDAASHRHDAQHRPAGPDLLPALSESSSENHGEHEGRDHGTPEEIDHGAHEGMDHSAHEGHGEMDHGAHEGMDHSAHEGHGEMDHGAHEGMGHSAHEGHGEMDHGAHEGMDHSADEGHGEMDHGAHEGMDHSAHEGHGEMDHGAHEGMDHSAHEGHGEMDHGAHGGMDHSAHGGHGGMDMSPGGIPLAEGGEDRDGLEMDVLTVRLGPVLPYWPAGFVLRCSLQGDVITTADAELVDPARSLDAPPDSRVRSLDNAVSLLALAGWEDAAAQARRVRDTVLERGWSDVATAGLHRLRRKVRRSWLLRWSLRGVAEWSGQEVRYWGLPSDAVGDAYDRLLRMLDRAASDAGQERSYPIESLAQAVTGLDLASARLALASFDAHELRTAHFAPEVPHG